MDTAADIDRAFPSIVAEHQDALYRFALRLSGSSHDAEEVAQEAFVRAYRWLQAQTELPTDLQVKPWLYRVCLNVFRNRLRRRQPASVSLQAAHTLATHDVAPEAAAEAGETRAELARCLAELPLRYREAVVLRHVEELTYPEAAAVLGRPEGTIKSDVHRGLALLRAALAPLREEALA